MATFQSNEQALSQDIYWSKWEKRNKEIASLISKECSSVMDFGAGNMQLRKFISSNVTYFPVDYIARCKDTIVCDFNKKEFPKQNFDCAVLSGCFEYIKDTDWFLSELNNSTKNELIISYNSIEDLPDIELREASGFQNHFSFNDFVQKIQSFGFLLFSYQRHFPESEINEQWIFKFIKKTSQNLGNYLFCSGCGACTNICPSNALKMYEDDFGFLKPKLDPSKCIKCNKCIKTCPSLNLKKNYNIEPESYACMADDKTRKKSSSGGIFSLLAEKILSDNGIVFGVSWKTDFSVHHISIKDKNDLHLLQKSKYIQSNTEKTFSVVATYLTEGKKVLYCGTPCQITGLRSFLDSKQVSQTKIITIDLLCSHVLSPKIFQQYLIENYDIDNLKSFTFRDKKYGWNPSVMKIEFKDGRIEYKDWNNDFLQKAFRQCLLMNKTCEHCFWCKLPRTGDITIGDFWGIESYNPLFSDKKGTSAVLINSEKGKDLFSKISNKLIISEAVPLELHKQGQLSGYRKQHPNQEMFLDLIKSHSFNDSVKYCISPHFDIGLLSLWTSNNYGTCITYFSLYKILKNMGYVVSLLDRPMNSPYPPPLSQVKSHKVGLFESSPYKKYEIQTPSHTRNEMRWIAEKCDTFLIGSDQLYNNDLFNALGKAASLDFVPNSVRKIAYAASWGKNIVLGTEKEKKMMAYYLHRFDSFSVREKGTVDLVHENFNITVENVLDPVFLCPIDDLNKLATSYDAKLNKTSYLYSYMLDPSREKGIILQKSSDKLNLPIIVTSDYLYSDEYIKLLWDIPTENKICEEKWIAYIKNSNFIITDSFHGMCMAIIYHKNFIALCNDERGAERFVSILSLLQLKERLVFDLDKLDYNLLFQEIDYQIVEKIIKKEKEKSILWLKKALSIPKINIPDNFDFLSEKINIQESNFDNYKSLSDKRFSDIDLFAKGCVARLDALDAYNKTIDLFIKSINSRFSSIDDYAQSVNRHIADLESQNRIQRKIQKLIRKLRNIIHRRK